MNPFTRLVNPTTKLYARTALDWDLVAGIVVGVIAGALMDGDDARSEGVTLALAAGAVGVAIMSVVLTALAVIAAFFDGPYRRVLEAAGGIREATAPYLVVAAVAGCAVIVAVLTAIGWAVFSPAEQVTAIGVAAFLMGWCVAGMIALVELTIFHATQRAALMRNLEETGADPPLQVEPVNAAESVLSVRRTR